MVEQSTGCRRESMFDCCWCTEQILLPQPIPKRMSPVDSANVITHDRMHSLSSPECFDRVVEHGDLKA
jgi:hypothetical protein